MKMISLFRFICLILTWTHIQTSERPNCYECDNYHICSCSAKDFQHVPIVPPDVLSLDVSFNKIEFITQEDLSVYTELRTLKLQWNKLGTIHKEAFHSQSKLEELDLSFNNLENISSVWFSKLQALKHLNILGNRYTTLGSVALFEFVENPTLKTLQFGNPLIEDVRRNMLHKVRRLDELTFVGGNLKSYENRSFQTVEPIRAVSISLQGFQNDSTLVSTIFRDVSHPETSLTIRDITIMTNEDAQPFKEVKEGCTRRLTFQNASMTDEGVTKLLEVLDGTPMSYFGLEDAYFVGHGWWQKAQWTHYENLHMLFIRNLEIQGFFMFSSMMQLAFLLKHFTRVSIINSTVFVMPCNTSALLQKVEYLDMSQNLLSDITLQETLCNGDSKMRDLNTLNVSYNSLKSFHLLPRLVSRLHRLTSLDLSHNDFLHMPQSCTWPASLSFLNLSATKLHRITPCLPQSLTVLDLSHNYLIAFHHHLPNLVELWLTGNRFISLPDGGQFPSLRVLLIQINTLNMFNQSNLMAFQSLRFLEAGQNNFVCSCDFVNFFQGHTDHLVKLRDGRRNYVCDSPFTSRGLAVDNVQQGYIECHMILSVSILCFMFILFGIITVIFCYKCHVCWYLKMVAAWLKAKSHPAVYSSETDIRYDAFVSYSQHDAEWVEEILVPKLENSGIALCLHKRDFQPGGWIMDNIIESIESSYRTLFVLSENFVKSDWCSYELNFSHFRIRDEHNDSAVLILLEPIVKESIPMRFCKLRRIMNSRTYLEWPQDEDNREEFWHNLRAALKREDD
ncbi:toll-like receptor 2 [Silurus meridionalis]|nr:toll-like receptor 2 [Silurus meridionalis]XP_046693510.1 toll-like receptor 2 [Silurus meridionalis]KAI5090272.1 toll-like receptor 2 isoform X1 [Silurus meridionalis]